MDEPSVTKRILETTLKILPDDLDKDAHAALDESVLRGSPPEPLNSASGALLLIPIVAGAKQHLNQDYRDLFATEALLDDHPLLLDMLSDAWKAKKFQQIRNLGVILVSF